LPEGKRPSPPATLSFKVEKTGRGNDGVDMRNDKDEERLQFNVK
jgi:hypothetical protein